MAKKAKKKTAKPRAKRAMMRSGSARRKSSHKRRTGRKPMRKSMSRRKAA
jgi:hypothetical protein